MSRQRLVLVLNSGSSSIKYRLFDMHNETVLASGLLEQLGSNDSRCQHGWRDDHGDWQQHDQARPIQDHRDGLALIEQNLASSGLLRDSGGLYAVGHRVVHGGEAFTCPTRIDASVIDGIRATIPLAPLHNPANLLGIELSIARLSGVPQVAVFDTAFHHSLPPHAYRYALPQALYQQQRIRRYGFHGSSHSYVSRQAATMLGRPLQQLKLISLHLGNGASAAAVQAGRSIDTSMGMTPLEGLVMGTRSGDLDPAIVFHLNRQGYPLEQIEDWLNHHSGLEGIAADSDMRRIIARAQQGDTDAELALELFCYRIKKYIGAYSAALGGLDAIIFTGGIGEHAAEVRRRVCSNMEVLGIVLDPQRNHRASGVSSALQARASRVAVLLIATNEELEIAAQTVATITRAEPETR